ncbi:hypothetical protein Bca52824_035038 [Brassica carinata]|uniref:Uncharacterized protein n=1 Tax=Brassica carinata TaxID=52824 RepID=A0A8X7V3R1_BRACI|nr:hypothetical protein Bca52824_035038 [Brassica carinata]
MKIEKDERLILKIDKKGIWRDKEGRPRSSTRQLINAEGTVILDVIVVAEMNTFGRTANAMIGKREPFSRSSS